jgi:hypothetical protein
MLILTYQQIRVLYILLASAIENSIAFKQVAIYGYEHPLPLGTSRALLKKIQILYIFVLYCISGTCTSWRF